MHGDLPEAVLFAQAVVLIITTALLVYPVVAYARNVAYTEAFVLLALSFASVAAVGALDFVIGAHTASNAVRVVGAVFAVAGVWFFARDFVQVGGSADRPGFGTRDGVGSLGEGGEPDE